MTRVLLFKAGETQITVRTEPEYLKDKVENAKFRRAIDGAEFHWGAKRWTIRHDQLLTTVQRLEAAQFEVVPHSLLMPLLAREYQSAIERVQEADDAIATLEKKLQAEGKSLFAFQRLDIRFLASRNRVINANEQGLGKCQPISELVLVPSRFELDRTQLRSEFAPIGRIETNDYVIGSNGFPTRVTAVYPQGRKPVFQIVLEDGRKVRCGWEHLWHAKSTAYTIPTIVPFALIFDVHFGGEYVYLPVLIGTLIEWKRIAQINEVDDEECVCIAVEAPDHLYVTNDFIVTHNTIETLCALEYGAAVLVCCPKEAKPAWERECKEWRDDFVVHVIEKKKEFRLPAAHEMIICNFDLLPPASEEPFPAPLTVVGDEIHKLKGKTARAAAVRSYARERAVRAFGLTGTPLPNDPLELWGILSVFGLEREVFGSFKRLGELFHAKRVYYFTSHVNPETGETKNKPNAAGWRFGVCPTNFGTEIDWRGKEVPLPDWMPVPTGCEIAFKDSPNGIADCPTCHGEPIEPSPEVAEMLKRVMVRHEKADVLKDLPAKIYKVMSVPLDKKTVKEIDSNVDHLVREALLDAEDLDEVMELHAGLIHGRMLLAQAKISYATQLLDEWEAENIISIAFSAHRAPIEVFAKRAGWTAIIGGMTEDRGTIQRDFQAGEYRGLAATIGAASTSLTLTRATREIFVDRSWVPADNDQAEDRAHRIGQTAGLIVVDLVAEHPIDRHVHILNNRKRGIIRATIGRVAGNRDVQLPLLRALHRAGAKEGK